MYEENFIHTQYLNNTTICDDIISMFHKNIDKAGPGRVGYHSDLIVDKDIKDSYDLSINPKEAVENEEYNVVKKYLDELKIIANKYIEKFPYCNEYSPWGINDYINIQWYKPNGGFKKWHTERNCATTPHSSRHLVWMTFLNDVDDGGETNFFHQRIKIPPKKGLTIIWPADWTYTHKGLTSLSQDKYIITGWYNFLN